MVHWVGLHMLITKNYFGSISHIEVYVKSQNYCLKYICMLAMCSLFQSCLMAFLLPLFLMVHWVGLYCANVVFPGHTH